MSLLIRRQKHLSGDEVAGWGADALGGDDVHVDDLKAGLGVEALQGFGEGLLEGGLGALGFVDGHGKFKFGGN
jgi:hypothetical protein